MVLVRPQRSRPADRAGPPGFLPRASGLRTQSQLHVCCLSTMWPGARSLKGMSGPAPTRCVQAECFDQLIRHCVACSLLRTPEPREGKRGTLPHGQGALGRRSQPGQALGRQGPQGPVVTMWSSPPLSPPPSTPPLSLLPAQPHLPLALGRPSLLPTSLPPCPPQQQGRAARRRGRHCSRRSQWARGPQRPRCPCRGCFSGPLCCWAWRWPWPWSW